MSTVGLFHAESLKFDKRLIRMNEKSGVLAPGEYEKSVTDLPDLKDNAVAINLKGDSQVQDTSAGVPAEAEIAGSQDSVFGSVETSGAASETDEPSNTGNTSGGGFFGV